MGRHYHYDHNIRIVSSHPYVSPFMLIPLPVVSTLMLTSPHLCVEDYLARKRRELLAMELKHEWTVFR